MCFQGPNRRAELLRDAVGPSLAEHARSLSRHRRGRCCGPDSRELRRAAVARSSGSSDRVSPRVGWLAGTLGLSGATAGVARPGRGGRPSGVRAEPARRWKSDSRSRSSPARRHAASVGSFLPHRLVVRRRCRDAAGGLRADHRPRPRSDGLAAPGRCHDAEPGQTAPRSPSAAAARARRAGSPASGPQGRSATEPTLCPLVLVTRQCRRSRLGRKRRGRGERKSLHGSTSGQRLESDARGWPELLRLDD